MLSIPCENGRNKLRPMVSSESKCICRLVRWLFDWMLSINEIKNSGMQLKNGRRLTISAEKTQPSVLIESKIKTGRESGSRNLIHSQHTLLTVRPVTKGAEFSNKTVQSL